MTYQEEQLEAKRKADNKRRYTKAYYDANAEYRRFKSDMSAARRCFKKATLDELVGLQEQLDERIAFLIDNPDEEPQRITANGITREAAERSLGEIK